MPYKAITSIRSDAQIRGLLRRLCLRRFSTHIPSAQARSVRASDSMLSPRNRARSCFQTAIQLDPPLRAAAYPLVGVRVHRCASRRNPTTLLRSRYSSIQREPHRKRQRQGLLLPWSEFRVCPRIRQWRNSSKEQWRGWSQISKPRTSKSWYLSNILVTTLVWYCAPGNIESIVGTGGFNQTTTFPLSDLASRKSNVQPLFNHHEPSRQPRCSAPSIATSATSHRCRACFLTTLRP